MPIIIDEMKNGWTERIKELEDENKRLQKMNPCGHTGFESAPCDICGYPDPRKLIARLKDERDADRRREYGYSQQTVDALTLERDKLTKRVAELEAKNKRLRELVDGAKEIVEIANCTSPAQCKWKIEWMQKAREALKKGR